MAGSAEDKELREKMGRLDGLLKEIDRLADPKAQARIREIVAGLMEFHGAAIERLLSRVAESGQEGVRMIERAAEDEAVAGLLLLYGLHPVDLETRVGKALEKTRPYLHSHGGDVELIGIVDGVVRLRMEGSCQGCPSSAVTLKQTIEEAIFEAAPDVAGIEVVEEIAAVSGAAMAGRFALPILAAS